MSISLKNVDDRLRVVENSPLIVDSKLDANGYIQFSNGLLINYGGFDPVSSGTISFSKPFTSTVYAMYDGHKYSPHLVREGVMTVKSVTLKDFSYYSQAEIELCWFLAIGILYSNRVKSFLFGGDLVCR